MKVGAVVAERYRLERLAGVGGMGAVWRAWDLASGGPVALKLLAADDPALAARAEREAAALAALDHPGVVRYVAHGAFPHGGRYLAMEWLTGEDLAARLGRGPLALAETVALAAQVCAALAAAHGRGIVHRDVKPSNLFLLAGDTLRVKVVDFGIARVDMMRTMTGEGGVVGSPGYMAPEQARGGDADVDGRADVFSLGCVLYRCLAGRAAFAGEHLIAILAKIIFDPAPDVRAARPEVPADLAELLGRMLAKERAARPELVEVAARLATLGAAPAIAAPTATAARVTGQEQRHVSVVLAARAAAGAQTIPLRDAGRRPAALAALAGDHAARLEALADGTLVAVFAPTAAATDAAGRAARFALALRAILPEPPIAVATGRSPVIEGLPSGEVIDAAARLLRRAGGQIRVDDATAGLLAGRFEVDGDGTLTGERLHPDGTRRLLGKPTTCVGRERELALLEGLLEECLEERSPRGVLVTGGAGLGKSRLRHEFVRAARERTQVWIGAGDPMRAGSPLGLLAEAVRRAVGIDEGEAPAARRTKLEERMARRFAPHDARRVAEFLGELCGAPFPDEASVQLRAARQDARLMGDQLQRAWEDWLQAEADAQPVLLVLEDLHWGDRATLRFVHEALRNLADRPIFLVTTARPEIHALFPEVWRGRRIEEVRLRELPRRACERLVREVLGEQTAATLVEQIVARAGGNAFCLEEVIRAVAEGHTEVPGSVLAMVESRLRALPPEARQTLRAASVYGQHCWSGAIATLLGRDAADTLALLADREWLHPRRGSRFAGELEYVFGHSLLREAAYASMTDADRALGHRLAADWLEQAGEPDAVAVAQHWLRGGEPARAVGWYLRAAELAFEGNDLPAAIEHAEHGVACGAAGAALGRLRGLQAEVHNWRTEWEQGRSRAHEATALLAPAAAGWAQAMHQAGWAAFVLGRWDELEEIAAALRAPLDAPLPRADASCAAQLASFLALAGRTEVAVALLELLERSLGDLPQEPALAAVVARVRAAVAGSRGDLGEKVHHSDVALARALEAGNLRTACLYQMNRGVALLDEGNYEAAEADLRAAVQLAERMGLANIGVIARHNLGPALMAQGRLPEARALLEGALAAYEAANNRYAAAYARIHLAQHSELAGDLEGAAREAEEALVAAAELENVRAYAHAVSAHVHLRAGRSTAALAAARAAQELLPRCGLQEGAAYIRVVHAEALHAVGEHQAAREALAAARDLLLAQAARLAEPERQARFLERVPEHVRTIALARAWGL